MICANAQQPVGYDTDEPCRNQSKERDKNNLKLIAIMDALELECIEVADLGECSKSSIDGYRADPNSKRYQKLSRSRLFLIEAVLFGLDEKNRDKIQAIYLERGLLQ